MGIYRLFTDHTLRKAVWDKVKHATVRGLGVGTVFVLVTYSTQRWFVQNFLMGGYGLFGKRAIKPPSEILETGLSWLQRIDTVQCKCPVQDERPSFTLEMTSYMFGLLITHSIHRYYHTLHAATAIIHPQLLYQA